MSNGRADALLPPQVHAGSLHDLVDHYVEASLGAGDLGALDPLRLLRDRVEYLLGEHALLAHEADGHPWREVPDSLGVSSSTMSSWDRAVRLSRSRPAVPRPTASPPTTSASGSGEPDITSCPESR